MARAKNTKKLKAFDLVLSACWTAVEAGQIDTLVGIIPGDADEFDKLADETCQVIEVV